MSEAPRPSPHLPTLAAFLLPGAGHALAGKTWPAVFVGGTILPLFVAGAALGGFENVSWERHPWMFGLQVLTGLPAGVTALLTRDTVLTEPLAHRTVGDLFTCVAGLLNLVATVDVWTRCREGDPEERLARQQAEAAEPPAPESVADLVARPAGPVPPAPEAPRG